MSSDSSQLWPVDAAWWHMEHPTNLMMITGVLLCKGQMDFDRVCDTYRERLLKFPRFRQRVVESTLGLGPPHWEDDPYFRMESHLHHIALPGAGTREQLTTLISDLAATPLDYAKPLWQVHVVDNAMGGSALIMRLHHCIGDGSALVATIMYLLDHIGGSEAPELPERTRHKVGLLGTLTGNATRLLKGTRSLLTSMIDGVQNPSQIVEFGRLVGNQASRSAAVVGRALSQPADALTPLKGKLGVAKRVAWCDDILVAQAKETCAVLGLKINDLIVAAMAGALRTYLLQRSFNVDGLEIHAVVPVDMRPQERALELGNVFGLVFLALPIGLADPLGRSAVVKQRMDALKRSDEAMLYYSLLSIVGLSPKQIEENVVDFFGSKATMVFTNVVGPRRPLAIAGTEIDNIIFWVPQSGRLGMGISIFSYNGRISVGVVTDAGLAPDPERIAEAFAHEFRLMQRVAFARAAVDTQQAPEKPLCVAFTRSGSGCRNPALAGMAYCRRHLNLLSQPGPSRDGESQAA